MTMIRGKQTERDEKRRKEQERDRKRQTQEEIVQKEFETKHKEKKNNPKN